MIKTIPVYLLAAFFVAGCAAKQTVLQDEYSGTTIKGKSLIIATVLPAISNPEDVGINIGDGNPQQVFLRFFSSQFLLALSGSSTFEDISFSTRDASVPLRWHSPTVASGEQILLALPPDGATVQFDSVQADFVLFIGRFLVRRTAPQPAFEAGMGVTGGSSGMLTYETDYAIWDNSHGRMVSYGRAIAESHIAVFQMTKWNWEACAQLLANKIVEDTPFKK